MLLDNDKATERLTSERNLANRFGKVKVTPMHRPGKVEGTVHLSGEAATTVAILARSGENQTKVGAIFGVTQEAVSQIKTGINAKRVDENLVERKLNTIRDSALDKLTSALLNIGEDKLEKASAKDLSGIAANLSKVVDTTRGKGTEREGNHVEVHIYSPDTRREDLYKTIEI